MSLRNLTPTLTDSEIEQGDEGEEEEDYDQHRASSSTLQDISLSLDAAPTEERISFYVQAFEEMLSILQNEAFLFDENEQWALARFVSLDYQSKYLFIRLFLRKNGFVRLGLIEYKEDIKDLRAACEALWETKDGLRTVEGGIEVKQGENVKENIKGKGKEKQPVVEMIDLTMSDDDDDEDLVIIEDIPIKQAEVALDIALAVDAEVKRDYSHFAYGNDALDSLDSQEMLELLYGTELIALGKKMKVTTKGNTRKDWVDALIKTTSNQATLSFAPVSSKKGKEKATDTKLAAIGLSYDATGKKQKQSGVVAIHARKIIGDVIKLHPAYIALFDRLSLVYHRTSYTSSTSSTSSLVASLLARFGKRHYPEYVVTRTFSIFESLELLREYEKALELEMTMEVCCGETRSVWPPPKPIVGAKELPAKTTEEKKSEREEGWEKAVKLFDEIWPRWKMIVESAENEFKAEEEDKDVVQEKKLLYYRKRFHPGWPLTRVIYKAASIFAKQHAYDREIDILRALLAQRAFRRGKRGAWYDRLALLLMRYNSAEEETAKPKAKVRLAKARLKEALDVCEKGLQDPFTHLIYQSSLQRRILRIESTLEVEKAERRVFDEMLLKADTRIMEGERIDEATTGRKSVWQANDGEEVSVEELALEQYKKEGWKGFHSENGILTMIFALCMWDIIFAPVDGVFETRFQSAPLDLSTDAFAIVREKRINKILAAIEAGKAGKFLEKADDRERERGTFCVGVRWNDYSKEDLLEIVDCLGGHAVAVICRVFSEEFNHRTGGIPDLCLWKPNQSEAMFVEVKGPGDTLSETQKVWINVLLSTGTSVEICKVMTSDEKDKLDERKRVAAAKRLEDGKGKKKKRKRGEDEEEEKEEDDD